jgi:hypothetical protein
MDGARGFILPRDREGRWLDLLPAGHSRLQHPTYRYTPVTAEGPWYTPWWGTFFYEATSWEYSLSIPHDVEGLIEACGGQDAFERRLDRFFDHGYYNVNNEPSFLTPCLYHWIGRPDRTADRVRQIIARHYHDGPAGLPGNDDSGAMSSWLVFHMMGLYPNAGTDYYLIHSPLVASTTLTLADGRSFTIRAEGLSERNRYIQRATLNGQPHALDRLTHRELMEGGTLTLKMGSKAMGPIPAEDTPEAKVLPPAQGETLLSALVTYKLHGQTRRYTMRFSEEGDTLRLDWSIPRNGQLHQGIYRMTPRARLSAPRLSYAQPIDGEALTLDDATFGLLPREALQALRTTGHCRLDGTDFRLEDTTTDTAGRRRLHAKDDAEGSRLIVLDDDCLPLILQMTGNPVEIDWEMNF